MSDTADRESLEKRVRRDRVLDVVALALAAGICGFAVTRAWPESLILVILAAMLAAAALIPSRAERLLSLLRREEAATDPPDVAR